MSRRLLFVENRGKTQLWESVARALATRGHHVSWMVQNPAYHPTTQQNQPNCYQLPFPLVSEVANHSATANTPDDGVYPELVAERGRRFFQAGSAHYNHYAQAIDQVLHQARPELVIGESTLFHELIAIHLCRSKQIPYLHPCGTRYPSGRFSMLVADTQITLGGQGIAMPNDEALALANNIALGIVVPAYMQKIDRWRLLMRKQQLLQARTKVWWGRMKGERYNTPSLTTKWALERALQVNLARWASLARTPPTGSRALLYPLQMQPETNIDVWGRPYHDQVAIIEEMLQAAPQDVAIVVKANPKSKYEVSSRLLTLANHHERLYLLPLQMTMSQAQALSIGTLTVTGTVGLEALMGKGRAISLCHPVIEEKFPSHHAASVADAVSRLLSDPTAGVGHASMGQKLIQTLHMRSYPGLISEPIYDPDCMHHENIVLIANAIDDLLSKNLHKSVKL